MLTHRAAVDHHNDCACPACHIEQIRYADQVAPCDCKACRHATPDTLVWPLAPEIHAFDPDRRDNAAAFSDLADLGMLPDPVVDLTHGEGSFWKRYRPAGLVTNDLHKPADHHHDLRQPLPSEWRGRFRTVVIDLPFKLNGSPTDSNRYGVHTKTSMRDRLFLFEVAIPHAAALVAPGWNIVVKYQDQVAGGKGRRQSLIIHEALTAAGFRWVNDIHVRCPRAQERHRGQVTVRNSHSTATVWRPLQARRRGHIPRLDEELSLVRSA